MLPASALSPTDGDGWLQMVMMCSNLSKDACVFAEWRPRTCVSLQNVLYRTHARLRGPETREYLPSAGRGNISFSTHSVRPLLLSGWRPTTGDGHWRCLVLFARGAHYCISSEGMQGVWTKPCACTRIRTCIRACMHARARTPVMVTYSARIQCASPHTECP
jgi:hypothetical protein